jgi:ketosteroid isomerase-like protein
MTRPLPLRHAALAALLLFGACVHVKVARESSEPDRKARIAAASREFSARYERGDAVGQAALYTDDGIIFPPGRAAIRGRAAIEAYWRLPAGDRVISHRATADSVVLEGATAYDWGTYAVAGERNGQSYSGGGKYVIVWREVQPGDWRMHLDMWNAGPPRTSAP